MGDRLGVWSDYAEWHTTKQAVYFTVTFDQAPAAADVPYLVVDDSSTTSATLGSYQMTALNDTTYEVIVEGVSKDDVLKFVAARNTALARGFEQFDPDDPTYLRSVTVTALPTYEAFSVAGWRWYDPTLSAGEISTADWAIADRDQFVLSAGLEPIYDESFEALTDGTMEAITTAGLRYVTIHYAKRVITNGDPVETTNQKIVEYPDQTETETLLTAATTAGLTPILMIDFPIDPDNEEAILEQMAGTHANSYYSGYLTRWREAMNDGVDFAIANNIGIVVLDTDFYDFTFQDDTQQFWFSYIIQNDLLPVINSGFSGVLTTEELNTDADFSWYSASEIDWVGDSWYPDLTNSANPTISDLYTEALAQLDDSYAAANATYGKPIFFSQLGVMSWDGAIAAGETFSPDNNNIDPDKANNSDYPRDYQEQADAYEALFRAMAERSLVIGAGSIHYTYYIQHDKLSNIRNKPAEQVWARWEQLFSAAL